MMVIFSGEEPQLLLVNVVRGADGTVRKGDVVNGAWELEITPAGVMLAKTGETVVNSWPLYPATGRLKCPVAGGVITTRSCPGRRRSCSDELAHE